MSKHAELFGILQHFIHLARASLSVPSEALLLVQLPGLLRLLFVLDAGAFKMPFTKFNSALILFRLFSQSVVEKCPNPPLNPLSFSFSLKATPMAGGRRKSIWHRLLLLIFRCVLFSVKIKLLICAFVCVDLDRFASFRWLKRRPLPHPPQKETQTRTWARGGRKLFSGPSTNTHKKHFGSPFWRCLFVCLLACLFLYVGLFYG